MTTPWKFIKSGDIIDIIAPASKPSRKVLMDGVKKLKALGFKPRFHKGIISNDNPFHSNSDTYRLKHLYQALSATDSKVVWCVRGGYGCNRLLPELEKLKKPKSPKILIGYSDITSLHIFLDQKWNWVSFHGPQFDRIGGGRMTASQEKETFGTLNGTVTSVVFKNLKPLNRTARKKQNLRGTVTGGNMMVLQSTIGTKNQLNTKGKILFLEEIDERGYRMDRILEHYKQAGVLKGCKAIVFGEIVGGAEANGKNYCWYAINRFAESLKIPVFSGIKTGHGANQRVVPFNTKALLVTGAKAHLTVETGGR